MENINLNFTQLIIITLGLVVTNELLYKIILNKKFRQIGELALKAVYLIRKSFVSDHWKQKVLPVYAFRIIFICISFLFYITLALIPFILSLIITNGLSNSLLILIKHPIPLTSIVVISSLQIFVRKYLL